MPENGVTGSSSFEDVFREARGRPPTAQETQRVLACNRLLRTTEFDPVTVFLTIFGEEHDRAAERIEAAASMSEKAFEGFAERLERVEQGVDDLKKQKVAAAKPVPAPVSPEITTQLERIESKLDGLKTVQRTYSFVRDAGFLLGGIALVLGVQWMLAAQHVIGQSWLIWRCMTIGAALVVLILFAAIKFEQLSQERRWH